jgi:hypothetical protein
MATYNAYEKKQDVIGPNGRKGTVISSPAMQAAARGFIPNFGRKFTAAELRANPDAQKLYKDYVAGGGKLTYSSYFREGGGQGELGRLNKKIVPVNLTPNQAGIFTTGRSVSTRATMDIARVDALKTLGAAAGEKRFAGLDGLKIGGIFKDSWRGGRRKKICRIRWVKNRRNVSGFYEPN